MKLKGIFALFIFGTVVKGWTTFLQPIVLTIGAVFTALNFDVEPLLDMKWPKWFIKKKHASSYEERADEFTVP